MAAYIDMIGPSFTAGTAQAYKSYWSFIKVLFGDRPIDTIGVDDCQAVVSAAVTRARRARHGSGGPSSQEN